MTYLAPRQGLFAIIILVSFCLQTLLLVISTDQQLTKIREQKGQQMVAQLIDEARLSLENKDRVSLSVIANRYTSEQDVARILIKDNNGELLVPVGNAPMQQGETIEQMATKGDAVIGSVALTLKDISKGEIITMQWPFVIGSLIFHLFLWLLYGYVARPTKEQINALSRDIQDLHRERYVQSGQLAYGRDANENDSSGSHPTESYATQSHASNTNTTPNNSDQESAHDQVKKPISTAGIHDEVNAYLRGQQQAKSTTDDTQSDNAVGGTQTQSDGYDFDKSILSSNRSSSIKHSITTTDGVSVNKFTSFASKLSTTRAFDSVSVQIMFHDEFNMLERLSPEMRMPYLALCTQLLSQAVTELLKQPLLLGVSAMNEPRFDGPSACVELKAENNHAKVALAGVMLGKLYLMLNKIIHDKHIELSRFALPAKVGVSDNAQADAMMQLLKSVGRKEQMLILLPNAGLKQIGNHVQVQSLKRPTTVYERECAIFDGANDSMIQRLAEVRNAVLMTGNEEEV